MRRAIVSEGKPFMDNLRWGTAPRWDARGETVHVWAKSLTARPRPNDPTAHALSIAVVCAWVHVRMCMHGCVRACARTRACVRACARVRACMRIYAYVRVRVRAHARARAHA
eukprot:10732149-Alexandrium_andersonii.AAC.1